MNQKSVTVPPEHQACQLPTTKPPRDFISATWRGTTRVNDATGTIGISFDTDAGNVVRLRLSVEHARHLSESIAEYLGNHLDRDQADMSAGIPSPDGSPEEGQSVWPPARSSAACAAEE